MNKMKKAMTYMVGATVIAATSAYFAMPKDTRNSIRSMVAGMMKKDTNKDSCE